jgi:hypothetical protein
MCGAGARGSGLRRLGEFQPILQPIIEPHLLRFRRRAANDNRREPSGVVKATLALSSAALASALALVALVIAP